MDELEAIAEVADILASKLASYWEDTVQFHELDNAETLLKEQEDRKKKWKESHHKEGQE